MDVGHWLQNPKERDNIQITVDWVGHKVVI
jgi:hypothetical protein